MLLHLIRKLTNFSICFKMWLSTRKNRILPATPPTILHQSPSHHRSAAYVASFSFTPHVAPYVLHYVKELNDNGFDIIFISTTHISPQSLEQLKPLCRTILQRENIGLDFASWQAGLAATNYGQDYETVLVTNDSIFGPVNSLSKVFKTMEARNLDVWGILDSHQLKWHLQSYFVVFNTHALHSPQWIHFWQNIRNLTNKNRIIYDYELNLSRQFLKTHRIGSFISNRHIHTYSWEALRHRPLMSRIRAMLTFRNPNVFTRQLVNNHGFPFIKRDLFKTGSMATYGPPPWPVLPANGNYPSTLITDYLTEIQKITRNAFQSPS